ncbi:hypothetical protein B0H11DRAFT_1916717 [Mycena galericulata]|nr:hypothetical protein B0H11DRAFT_1916717 [Mycena galericulata]
MSTVGEVSVSLLSSLPVPTTLTAKVVLTACIVALTGYALRAASPTHLTEILVSTLAATENTYFAAIEAGLVLPEGHTELLTGPRLQMKVSEIRQQSLSQSRRFAFREFLKGRTLTVLECTREVKNLQTEIEILKEAQLRKFPSMSVTHNLYLRRRRPGNNNNNNEF